MDHLFRKKKIDTSALTVDLVIDAPVYEKLKKRAHIECITENDVLLYALTRGMKNFNLHLAKDYKEDYEVISKLFEQSKRDNELLNALVHQNVRFRQILDDKEKQGKFGVKNNEKPTDGTSK